jgi:antitoxin YefM
MGIYTVYRLNVNELDSQFIEALKTLFKDKDVEIIVSEVDETAYLLQSAANRQRLLQAIQHVNDQEHLVEVQLDSLP